MEFVEMVQLEINFVQACLDRHQKEYVAPESVFEFGFHLNGCFGFRSVLTCCWAFSRAVGVLYSAHFSAIQCNLFRKKHGGVVDFCKDAFSHTRLGAPTWLAGLAQCQNQC
jgi:hypothetical protein